MPLLRFTLSEDGVGALREALACLNKFSEEVSLEGTKDKVCVTILKVILDFDLVELIL
jgi:cell cycle checkpoint control protein RAD9A